VGERVGDCVGNGNPNGLFELRSDDSEKALEVSLVRAIRMIGMTIAMRMIMPKEEKNITRRLLISRTGVARANTNGKNEVSSTSLALTRKSC
jgi:hypothetical protein